MGKKGKTNTEDKPVGYGSSIQSSGHGNKSRPQQPIDENSQGEHDKDYDKQKEKNS